MIRINLLESERRSAKPVAPGFQAGQKIMVIGSLVMMLTVALIGWRYWSIDQQKAEVAREIEVSQREEARLQEILKQVQEFENRRKTLEARVALIDELRKGQTAPVHMIDQISRALPDMTWLTAMKQDGYALTIQGRCLSLTSLSDFIGSLEASRYFARPVEIIESSVVPGGDAKTPELIQFTIRGTFQMQGVDPAPPASAKGGRRG
jgi:type IV pilus assembly protein PilN